jgi:site-specific recombinase XerC
VRSRALQQFFSWLLDEEEIPASPMARLRPPKIPEQLTPVLEAPTSGLCSRSAQAKTWRAP